MNNVNAVSLIENCERELLRIQGVKETFGSTNHAMELLTKYSVIKCCGTIEQCFKTIIFDKVEANAVPQARNFIETKFRKSSMNPSLRNINTTLKQFDDNWNTEFKEKLNSLQNKNQLKGSLMSLNENRNKFAHGGSTTVTFDQVTTYFRDSCSVINILDEVIGS